MGSTQVALLRCGPDEKARLPRDPWMIAFLIVFIVYQIYRMTFAFSIGLLGLTIFDVVVVWLTYREYGKQRAARTPQESVMTSAP